MRKLLIVSPHFPPVNAPDMQRVRMSLGYYRRFGWEPVVLAVDPRDVECTQEPELLDTLPNGVRVVRVRALPARWTRLAGIGNVGIRSWVQLFRAGARLLANEHFDLVFFSNTQFITFTLGPLWQRLFRVPFVVDIQDQWLTSYYDRPDAATPPGGWKYRFAHAQARGLEEAVYRRAKGFISVSPKYLEELSERYPWFSEKPADVIHFGFAPHDFEWARKDIRCDHRLPRSNREVHLLYIGAAGPIMSHAVNTLFDAVAHYRARSPERAARLRFHFYGTSYAAPGHGRPSILPSAEQRGIADIVDEIPNRVGYLESLRLMLQSDALLLLGSNDPAYSPSKLCPYYLSGKPLLSIVFANSHIESLLQTLGCAPIVPLPPDQPKDGVYEAIVRFMDLASDGFPDGQGQARNDVYFNENFLVDSLTRRQCQLFNRAVETPVAGNPGLV